MPSFAIPEILVATDFCEPARRAISCARHIARMRGFSVRALHVLDLTNTNSSGSVSYSTARDSAERRLRDIRRELRLAGLRETATLIAAGRPAPAIRQAAAQYRSVLLVIGLNGARSRNISTLGATTRALLASAPCPILTISGACQDVTAASGFEHPLIVSGAAPGDLPTALASLPFPDLPLRPSVFVVTASRKTSRRLSRDHLDQLSPVVLPAASAAERLLHKAAEMHAGIIVFGLPSGNAMGTFASDTLAHALITQAPCPVLTFRC